MRENLASLKERRKSTLAPGNGRFSPVARRRASEDRRQAPVHEKVFGDPDEARTNRSESWPGGHGTPRFQSPPPQARLESGLDRFHHIGEDCTQRATRLWCVSGSVETTSRGLRCTSTILESRAVFCPDPKWAVRLPGAVGSLNRAPSHSRPRRCDNRVVAAPFREAPPPDRAGPRRTGFPPGSTS